MKLLKNKTEMNAHKSKYTKVSQQGRHNGISRSVIPSFEEREWSLLVL